MTEPQVLPQYRPTVAEVDLRRIRANFKRLRAWLEPGAFICPMVKANAYGHGDREVARVLRQESCPYLGVGLIEEGLRLRNSGDIGAILMFGLFDRLGAEAMIAASLTPVLGDWDQAEALALVLSRMKRPSAGEMPLPVHLKFNTGMNRLGFRVEDATRLRQWIDRHPGLRVEGVCTHLLHGEDAGLTAGRSFAQLEGLARALEAFADLNCHAHALNSSGMAGIWWRSRKEPGTRPFAFRTLGGRPGIGLYGVRPGTVHAMEFDLEPVLSWRSRLVMVRDVRSGETVSYSGTWKARRASRIGIVPVGYADGYVRLLSNRASVLCRGRRAPVIGTVCMDYFMIDLTDVEAAAGTVAPGDEVVLIGEQGDERIEAVELAGLVGTIPYEILTNISQRVPRHHRA